MADSNISAVATIGIPVTDQKRAVDFYVGTLGFEKRRDLPFGPARWIEVAPRGAATTIALVPPGMPPGIRLVTGDAAAAHAELTGRGADTDGQIMDTGGAAPPMFAVRDPDGNSLIIIENGPS